MKTWHSRILPQIIQAPGVSYIRLYRKTNLKIYPDGTAFTLGKAHTVRMGSDVAIIAEGPVMVPEALKAAELLEDAGISAV